MKVPYSNLACTAYSTRTLYDMKDVLYEIEQSESQQNKDLYFMYRQAHASENDLMRMKSENIRYDITIIPPGKNGSEYAKTYGHYHPLSPSNIPYPEIYQVLKGKATYILQKYDLSKFIVIKAEAKDIVTIPPGYGHVTINESDEELVAANWVSDLFSSDYELIKKKRGFLYYLTDIGFVKNNSYEKHPEITYEKPNVPKNGNIQSGKDMYDLINTPDELSFLNSPEKANYFFE